MQDIPVGRALILWNSPEDGTPPAFVVRPLGHPDYDEYDCQSGACYRYWYNSDVDAQLRHLMIVIWRCCLTYKIPTELMHPELLKIPEYREYFEGDGT